MGRQGLEQTARASGCRRQGHSGCRRNGSDPDQAIRRPKDCLHREQPPYLPRNVLYHAGCLPAFISGVILQDETIRQKNAGGHTVDRSVVRARDHSGDQSGYRCKGAAGSPEEKITEGL